MLSKEELKGNYLKYSPDITEEIFDKIINKLVEYFGESDRTDTPLRYLSFKSDYNYIAIFDGGFNWSLDNNTQGCREIQVSDIIDLEIKFEVGKFYTFYWNWMGGYNIIAKILDISEVGIRCDWYYNITRERFDREGGTFELKELNHIKELTKEEVQQYLPEGHKDKLSNFILPKCWHVVITEENKEILAKWRFEENYPKYTLSTGKIVGVYESGTKEHNPINSREGFGLEITFDQFKQYVLNEPKQLTIDDLIDGEFYYCTTNNKEKEWVYKYKKGKYLTSNDACIRINGGFYGGHFGIISEDSGVDIIKIADPIQKKWLKVCINQNKFIPQLELDKYDDEGNLIESNSAFEFNKWYKHKNADGLFFIQSDRTGYGFKSHHRNCWFIRTPDMGRWDLEETVPVTEEEVKERLLSYAKEKYPIGTKFKAIDYHKGESVIITGDIAFNSNPTFEPYCRTNGSTPYRRLLLDGNWAKIISQPAVESKEFDRNWYVEVNSQEEADAVFNWLESNGERINNQYIRFDKIWKFINCSINWNEEICYWSCNYETYPATYQKQLSDILPNYSKVDRNVYYKVENQDQYDEILNWLKSKGEKTSYRPFIVANNWKFVVYNLNTHSWKLSDNNLHLPKAEFQFKNKLKFEDVAGLFSEVCSGSKEELIPVIKSNKIPEIETVKNRFKTQPIKKRVLPEIY